jgi:hypothetical protein
MPIPVVGEQQKPRSRAPYLVPLAMMVVRADLAMRRKLFPKAKV